MTSEIEDEDDDEFEGVPEEDEDLDLVDEDDLEGVEEDEAIEDPKERAARSLKVRRAIEDRLEAKRLEEDLNYLDLDED